MHHQTFYSVLEASLNAEAKYSARLGPELDLLKTADGPSLFVPVDFEFSRAYEVFEEEIVEYHIIGFKLIHGSSTMDLL